MSKLHFNIAGGFTHFNIIKDFIKKFKNIYNLTVYDGLNCCAWNGGHLNYNIKYDENIHNFYKDNNTSIALTFSNFIIDLNDKTGNNLLEIFHDSNNYIILINNNLRKYIRKYYSKYKLIYSITGVCLINVPMQEYDINFYKQLEDDYDYIVPRREHIFDNNFNKLDKSRYEIMLNDCCVCNCPYFSKHYALISEVNRKYADQSPWEILGQENSQKIMECFIPNEIISSVKEYTNKIFKDLDKNGMHLTKKQVLDFIDRGFTRFKITGREMSSQDFYNDLSQDLTINYLLKRSK